MAVDRRTFLIGTLGGAAILSGVAGERIVTWTRRRSAEGWADHLSAAPGAFDLGVEYLRRFPDEAGALTDTLSSLATPFSAVLGSERSAEGLHERIRQDYVEGNIVEMGGWLLSRTELRLCALAAHSQQATTGVGGVFAQQAVADGQTVFWLTPSATFTVPSNLARLEFQLRAGAVGAQRVSVRIDRQLVDELPIADSSWRPVRYLMRSHEGPTVQLQLDTTPEWKPVNDFRTIGVGIDRTSWS